MWRLPSRSWEEAASGSEAREDIASAINDCQRQKEKYLDFSLFSSFSLPANTHCWPKTSGSCLSRELWKWYFLWLTVRTEEGREMDLRTNRQMGNQCTCAALQHRIFSEYQVRSFCAISFEIQLTFPPFPFTPFPSSSLFFIFIDLSLVSCVTHRCQHFLWKKSRGQRGCAKRGDQ